MLSTTIPANQDGYDLHGDDFCVPSPSPARQPPAPSTAAGPAATATATASTTTSNSDTSNNNARNKGNSNGEGRRAPKSAPKSAPSSLNSSALLLAGLRDEAPIQHEQQQQQQQQQQPPSLAPLATAPSSPLTPALSTNPIASCLPPSVAGYSYYYGGGYGGQQQKGYGICIVGTALDALIVAPGWMMLSGKSGGADGGADGGAGGTAGGTSGGAACGNGKGGADADGGDKDGVATASSSSSSSGGIDSRLDGGSATAAGSTTNNAATATTTTTTTNTENGGYSGSNGTSNIGGTSCSSNNSSRPTAASSDFVVQFPTDQVTDRIMTLLVGAASSSSTSTAATAAATTTAASTSPSSYAAAVAGGGGPLIAAASSIDSAASDSSLPLPSLSSSPLKRRASRRSSRKLIRTLSSAAAAAAAGAAGAAVASSSPLGGQQQQQQQQQKQHKEAKLAVPYVQVWINSVQIPELDMTYANFQSGGGGTSATSTSNGGNGSGSGGYGSTGAATTTQCRFKHGNSTRPSSATMEKLILDGKLREGVNEIEFRLVMPLGGGGGVDHGDDGGGDEQDNDGDSDNDGGDGTLPIGSQDEAIRTTMDPYKADSFQTIPQNGSGSIKASPSSPSSNRDCGGVLIAVAPATLHLWSSSDSVVVSDIDGTVTKSDVRGVLDTVVTERFEHVHGGVCDFFQGLASLDMADESGGGIGSGNGGDGNGNGEGNENGGNNRSSSSSSSSSEDRGKIRFLYLSSRPLSLVNSTRRFLKCLVQGVSNPGGAFPDNGCGNASSSTRKIRLPPGPLFCHPGSLSTVLLTELFHKNTHEFKADVLARQVVLPFVAAGRDCYSTEDDSGDMNGNTDGGTASSSRRRKKLFLAGFGNKATDAAAYEMAGMDKRDIYIIDKESNVVCMDGNDDDVMNGGDGTSRSPSLRFGRSGAGSTRTLLRKSVRRVKSFGSFRVGQNDESNDEQTRAAAAPASKPNKSEQTVLEDDECDTISEQLSATVESMLCGASEGVCCGGDAAATNDGVDCEICGGGGGGGGGVATSVTFGTRGLQHIIEEGTCTDVAETKTVHSAPLSPPPPPSTSRTTSRPPSVSPSLRHSVSMASPLARQSSTLSSKASYRRNKGMTFVGYDDPRLAESVRWKIVMDS